LVFKLGSKARVAGTRAERAAAPARTLLRTIAKRRMNEKYEWKRVARIECGEVKGV
jgi:hypothetical protein